MQPVSREFVKIPNVFARNWAEFGLTSTEAILTVSAMSHDARFPAHDAIFGVSSQTMCRWRKKMKALGFMTCRGFPHDNGSGLITHTGYTYSFDGLLNHLAEFKIGNTKVDIKDDAEPIIDDNLEINDDGESITDVGLSRVKEERAKKTVSNSNSPTFSLDNSIPEFIDPVNNPGESNDSLIYMEELKTKFISLYPGINPSSYRCESKFAELLSELTKSNHIIPYRLSALENLDLWFYFSTTMTYQKQESRRTIESPDFKNLLHWFREFADYTIKLTKLVSGEDSSKEKYQRRLLEEGKLQEYLDLHQIILNHPQSKELADDPKNYLFLKLLRIGALVGAKWEDTKKNPVCMMCNSLGIPFPFPLKHQYSLTDMVDARSYCPTKLLNRER